jgi:hypothetical protein
MIMESSDSEDDEAESSVEPEEWVGSELEGSLSMVHHSPPSASIDADRPAPPMSGSETESDAGGGTPPTQPFDETPPFSPDPDGRAVDGEPEEGRGVTSAVEPAEKQEGDSDPGGGSDDDDRTQPFDGLALELAGEGDDARSAQQPSSSVPTEQVAPAQPEEARQHTDEQPQGLEQVEVDLTAESDEERESAGDLADPQGGSGDGAAAGEGTGDASTLTSAPAPDCEAQVGRRATAPAGCSGTRRPGPGAGGDSGMRKCGTAGKSQSVLVTTRLTILIARRRWGG